MPSISLSGMKFPKGRMTFLYPILAVLLFIGLILAYYFLYEKAQVTVFLDKREVKKDVSVIFSDSKDTSATDGIVHIGIGTSSQTGTEEKDATGKKETGDKAKGEVTLYNKTEDKKTFAKGTTITGPNKLDFTLTDDVSIASTSSFATSFSSAKTKVEAAKFGKEYNLPSASNFQIGTLSTSDFFGKNESAFSGGSKKEIKVVSKDDAAALTAKIVSSLTQKAVSDASSKKGADEEILSVPVDYTFDEKTYSKKDGEEATSLSLTATITYKLGTYKKQELEALAKDLSKGEAPSEYSYSKNDSRIAVENVKKNDDGDLAGKISFVSVFLPQVSHDELLGKVAGKSADKAEELVQGKGVSDQQVLITRSLPFMPKILPFNKSNIDVIIKTQ